MAATTAISFIRKRLCPKCRKLMKEINRINHPIQGNNPDYKKWTKDAGGPPHDILILKCPNCGHEEQRVSLVWKNDG